jgi:hypothetical protein
MGSSEAAEIVAPVPAQVELTALLSFSYKMERHERTRETFPETFF